VAASASAEAIAVEMMVFMAFNSSFSSSAGACQANAAPA
jgi:hypothetical protein